jgi:hypothetical protein
LKEKHSERVNICEIKNHRFLQQHNQIMMPVAPATFFHDGISYFVHVSSLQSLFLSLVASFVRSQKKVCDGLLW